MASKTDKWKGERPLETIENCCHRNFVRMALSICSPEKLQDE